MKTNSVGEAASGMAEGIGSIVNPVPGLLESLMGNPTLSYQSQVRRGISDLFWGPFRMAGHIGLGTARIAGKTALNTVLNAPILPYSPLDVKEILASTRDDLVSLSNKIGNFNLAGGKPPRYEAGLAG